MAPRKPKGEEDSDFSSVSGAPSPLKPKTEKVKVTKLKAEKVAKPKAEKVKVEKVKKALAADGEMIDKLKKETIGKKDKTDIVGNSKAAKDSREKVVTVNGDEAIELIKTYLNEQNRPYSATEVSANLKGKVTKTVADKLLKELGETNHIMSKATKGNEKGSQWVFWALQDVSDNATSEELAAMDATIQQIKESLPRLRADLKIVGKKWETLKNAPTTRELRAKVEKMQAEVGEKSQTLKEFKEGKVERITKDVMDRVEKDLTYWGGKRIKRMKAFKELEDSMLESMEGTLRDDFREQIGFEEDVYGRCYVE